MSESKLLPAAVLVGACIIGAGLYFGLSHRPPALLPPTANASSAPSSLTAAATPSVTPAAREKQRYAAEKAAQQALEKAKPSWIAKCWAPAIARVPEPATARWTIDTTFNTKGIEIARGISDVRGAERADVAQCLRRLPMGLRIPPPPRNTRVTLSLTMP